jgi:transcriptional regulator with XRE-family HTH domain
MDESFFLVLASTLKELRERKQLTQKRLASLAGVTQATISELENGKANPTLDVIVKIAAALQFPPNALLGAGTLLGSLGFALGAPLTGAVVGALLGSSLTPSVKEWISSKLVEGFGGKNRPTGG